MNDNSPHISVLLQEVITHLVPAPGKTYVDCTFGAGGYSRALLDSCECNVIAIDRDETVYPTVEAMKSKYQGRFAFGLNTFSNIKDVLDDLGVDKVDGVVCDLGVSSMQIDNPEKGFSFNKNGPLSMQMGCNNLSAYDVVNTYDEEDIANIIYQYGEERLSRRIARAIVGARKEKNIETTMELSEIVAAVMPKKGHIHPATRTFQALRIYVNNELEEVDKLLESSLDVLNVGGRLVMVSFHSLEDRIVKNFFNQHGGKSQGGSRYLPMQIENKPLLKLITRKPVIAGDEELEHNTRSRSAKLRAAEKL